MIPSQNPGGASMTINGVETAELERELRGLYRLRTESPVPLSDEDEARIVSLWRELDMRYKTGK